MLLSLVVHSLGLLLPLALVSLLPAVLLLDPLLVLAISLRVAMEMCACVVGRHILELESFYWYWAPLGSLGTGLTNIP